MCGRFAQVIKYDQLQKMVKELKISITSEQIEISYNVAPTQTVVAIIDKDDTRYCGHFRWGLIPSWMKEIPKVPLFNVRSETIAEKPSFKASFIRRRAVVPATGFFEWHKADRTPHFIYSATGDLLYLAAIYDSWEGADGSFIPSLGIITTAANSFMSRIHDRMPVLMQKGDIPQFLDPNNQDLKSVQQMLAPSPEDFLQTHVVSKEVNKISNNYPELLEEYQDIESIPL